MRYRESKATSVTLVKQVLAALGPHDAALNPMNFAVFYEHVAGLNPPLSLALQRLMAVRPRLDDAALAQLYREHVVVAESPLDERIEGDMQRVMDELAQSAARTGAAAGAYGAQLQDLSGALDGDDAQLLGEQIDAVRSGTQAMRDSVRALQEQVVAGQREINRLREDLQRSRDEATQCPLTHVLNRRGFDHELATMLQTPPPEDKAHCLILIDIDHFKRVNDTLGHPVGDRVLEGLGAVLRSTPAEPGMHCARYGGEEFAILLPSTTVEHAVEVAESVRTRTRGIKLRNRATQAVELTITVSAGVAAWRPGDNADALLEHADGALYRAKADGRDRVRVAESEAPVAAGAARRPPAQAAAAMRAG